MDDIILGIWDGHDAGAAFIRNNEVLYAANEERFTRRKSEINFPEKSVLNGLKMLSINKEDIKYIAYSTSDLAKTLTRYFPHLKEKFYIIRRRKSQKPKLLELRRHLKYRLTLFGSSVICRQLSNFYITRKLKRLGFNNFKLLLYDHHLCHATSAAFCSGFNEAVVLTLDGIGDGYSGSYRIYKDGKLEEPIMISGNKSFGFFFEHVTNLLNMRELEDEGKVMALADFAYPVPEEKNPLMDLITINGAEIKFKHTVWKLYKRMKRFFWNYPSEQYARMAQVTLEKKVCELVSRIVGQSKINNIAISGGVASNIKVSMKIKELPNVDNVYVFPHMGDGGLAIGAALAANYYLNKISKYTLSSLFLGPNYSKDEISQALKNNNYKIIAEGENIIKVASGLLLSGEILLWYQGRMEYGPRALGGRSIIALPNSLKIKDVLNLKSKRRVWYQPFCPSILEEDAKKILINYDKYNPFMTMAYRINEKYRDLLIGVINIDGTCRPHIVNDKKSLLYLLLIEIKKQLGLGVLLNTSFNIHGYPIVESPFDALDLFVSNDFKYIALQDFLIEKRK